MSIGRTSITRKERIKKDLNRQGRAFTGLLWCRTGTSGEAVVNAALNVRIP
jgi:hypothetical protein